jgi:hypothetical protein
MEINMLRGILCLAAATLVLGAFGPTSAQPSPPSSSDDVSHWDASQKAQFNANFSKATHDSCLSSAQSHGAAADAAERYCSCVVSRLAPLSVEDKMALPQHQDVMVTASNACKA